MQPTNEPNNAIADKIIRGENVDIAEALAEEAKQRHRREQDAVRLQLLCARMAKAIGRNVEQRTLMASLAIMAAQAICHVHPSRHGRLYVDFLQALKAAIEGTYPKGVTLEPPDMSVLDRHIDVRVPPAGPGTPVADALPADVTETHAEMVVERAMASPTMTPVVPSPHEIAEAHAIAEQALDDLKIPAFLRKENPDANQG